ncbi:response regulator [Rivularia sp. PCC 7116]|uniref:response regulator n=1 Tax=Rivularia sp. PCC 7116 TaxID=373994 RepID=UPI00031BE054|nr:response regulator [Rivularia sp. PCC 7116]
MDKNHTCEPPLVLVVEDNEDNLFLISHILESLGCRVIFQRVGSEATVILAKEHHPDLILLDIVLPDVSGIDILQLLRQEPLTCDLPAIAVTALATEQNRENIIRAGFNNYIIKPYLIEELEEMIFPYICGKLNSSSKYVVGQDKL